MGRRTSFGVPSVATLGGSPWFVVTRMDSRICLSVRGVHATTHRRLVERTGAAVGWADPRCSPTKGVQLTTQRSIRAAAALSDTAEGELAAAEAADAVAVELDGTCDVAVVFVGGAHVDSVEAVAAAVEARLEPGVLIGGVAQGVIGPGEEVESGEAVSVWGAHLGGGHAQPVRCWTVPAPDGAVAVAGWPDTRPGDLVIVLADPYSFPAAEVVARVGERNPGLLVCGGLITAGPGRSRLIVDDRVYEDGAVGVVLSDVDAAALVSQGCRPIGAPLTVTAAEHNRILGLGGEPAVLRLQQVLREGDPEVRTLLERGGLQIGLVVDEVRDDYATGNFLVRGVVGVDPEAGAITIGDLVQLGQTVQFHVRDADSAHQDLVDRLSGRAPAAGVLLFTCNGRGQQLFGTPAHDVTTVENHLEGAVAGAFCAGEIGPVGSKSYLHGFTASLVLIGAEEPGADATGAEPDAEASDADDAAGTGPPS